MRFQFSFRHMETSEALKTYAEQKINQEIQKFSSKPIDCHITFSVDRHNHSSHIDFNGGDGFSFQVEHTCTDMYGSIDHMVTKVESNLRKQKEKLKNHKGNSSRKNIKFSERSYEAAEIDAADILLYEAARRKVSGR